MFRPPFWDLLMLQLLRPNSSNLSFLYSTFQSYLPVWRVHLALRSVVKSQSLPSQDWNRIITLSISEIRVFMPNIFGVLYRVRSLIQLESSMNQLESSLIQLESSVINTRTLYKTPNIFGVKSLISSHILNYFVSRRIIDEGSILVPEMRIWSISNLIRFKMVYTSW